MHQIAEGRFSPEQLSHELREHTSESLRRRRKVAALSLASIGALAVPALYQLGILRRVPEPRGRWFDSKRVNGAPEAYKYFETPDAFLGIVS